MKRPNWLLFISLGFFVKIFAFLKGQRITRHDTIKAPSIILSNHTSFYDFIYSTAAIYPHRVNYMAASKMFYDPVLGFFLRLARAFPKCLFQSDPVATLNAFRILKKKGIVSIFPEGQISPIGTTQTFNLAIGKMLKKAKVDVYMVKHHYAYLVNPPWTKKTFSGRVETVIEMIASKAMVESMKEEELNQLVREKLDFNTYEYNQIHHRKFHLNDIHNLESVIYQCPNCGYDQLTSTAHELHCPKCGSDFKYDEYGLVGGHRVDALYHLQEKTLQAKILSDPDFTMTANVKLESYRGTRVQMVGQGILTLNRQLYRFDGIVDGMPTVYEFYPKNVVTLPTDLGRNIQIYEDYVIYQFVFDEVTLPTQFVIAGEYLYTLANAMEGMNQIEK